MTKIISVMIFSGLMLLTVSLNATRKPDDRVIPTPIDEITDTVVKPGNSTAPRQKEISLLSDRQVYLYGEVTDENSPIIAKEISLLSRTSEPITVIINSPGGSVFAGAAIISAIQGAKGPVNTLCVGLCASMAAMIHSYGTNRTMLSHAVLMFHPASGGVQGTMGQMYARLNMYNRFVMTMESNVAARSKQSLGSYQSKVSSELWLDANDATFQGYNDQIVFVRGISSEKVYGDPSILKVNSLTPKLTW